MSIEKFNKALPAEIRDAGFDKPTAIQLQTLAVINSGADVFAVAPDGSGKTTAILMTVIKRLKAPFEEAPRALIIVADNEKALDMENQFAIMTNECQLRSDCIREGQDIQKQRDELYAGTDVVITTPQRLLKIFLKNGININKLKLFIIDDASKVAITANKVAIERIGESLPKCQRLLFTEVMTDKISEITRHIMPYAKLVEVTA